MSKQETIYYEDVVPGAKNRIGSYHVTQEEIIEYSRKWNPLPFHIDEEAAKQSIFGGLIASGWHTASQRHHHGPAHRDRRRGGRDTVRRNNARAGG